MLTQTGSTVRVHLSAVGLEPRQEHVQHVHRLEGGEPGACPGESGDRDGDGTLALDESLPAYGEVAVALEPFPRTGDGGKIEYGESLALEPEVEPLSDRVVVLYGLAMDGVYDPTVPVACGRLR